jgi:hypothetical protein
MVKKGSITAYKENWKFYLGNFFHNLIFLHNKEVCVRIKKDTPWTIEDIRNHYTRENMTREVLWADGLDNL